MEDRKFCSRNEALDFVWASSKEIVDSTYFNNTIDLLRKKIESSNKYVITDDYMDLSAFLALIGFIKPLYRISFADVASFIEKKHSEKYRVSKTEILGILSQAINEKNDTSKKDKVSKKETIPEGDMYKIVQSALKDGISKTEIQKKYKLTQRELTLYEGPKYWSNTQKNDHKLMLEYKRLHPNASDKEVIEKGCKKTASAYRYSLIPSEEEQEAYNKKCVEKPAPKAVIKGVDIKSLILSDEEKEEQENLYAKIKEIAAARNCSPRDITSLLKSRLVKDYGIVIEQIKKELMMKYRVNRGEGKAPNTLEAIVMSEYLPIAKSVLDDMLEESYSVR